MCYAPIFAIKLEIAFDSADYLYGDFSGSFSGFLISADLGVAVSLVALPALEFTANVGYDLHGLKEDTNTDCTYNFGALNFNVGAKYNF